MSHGCSTSVDKPHEHNAEPRGPFYRNAFCVTHSHKMESKQAALCCSRYVGTRSGREGGSRRLSLHIFIRVVLTRCFHCENSLRSILKMCVLLCMLNTNKSLLKTTTRPFFFLLPFRTIKRKSSIASCSQGCGKEHTGGNGSGNNL